MTAALTNDDTTSTVDANGEGLAHTKGTTTWTYTVKLEQKQDDWQTSVTDIGGVTTFTGSPKSGGTAIVTYDGTSASIEFK